MTKITEVYKSTDSKEALILRVDRCKARTLEIALKEFAERAATDMPCCARDERRMGDALRRAIS